VTLYLKLFLGIILSNQWRGGECTECSVLDIRAIQKEDIKI
jgi:hypothetical protein